MSIARLEALSAYLQHQRSLLARTQADIERLKRLREEISASPEHLTNLQVFRFLLDHATTSVTFRNST
jgi:hypothetical protein